MLLLALTLIAAQAPKEFEVASVRQNLLNDRIVSINLGPGGRFATRGYTLALLIQRAYGVMDWNIEGPNWIREDRWDLEARATVPGNITQQQLQPMLQALLADRFKLRIHNGSREMNALVLTVARGGPKLKLSEPQEDNADSFRLTRTELHGDGVSMRNFARFVAGKLGLVGVDKTGLPGYYDVKATWPEPVDAESSGTIPVDPKESLRTAVFKAIQAQLGLTMTSQRTSVETIVVDSVEKASAN